MKSSGQSRGYIEGELLRRSGLMELIDYGVLRETVEPCGCAVYSCYGKLPEDQWVEGGRWKGSISVHLECPVHASGQMALGELS